MLCSLRLRPAKAFLDVNPGGRGSRTGDADPSRTLQTALVLFTPELEAAAKRRCKLSGALHWLRGRGGIPIRASAPPSDLTGWRGVLAVNRPGTPRHSTGSPHPRSTADR